MFRLFSRIFGYFRLFSTILLNLHFVCLLTSTESVYVFTCTCVCVVVKGPRCLVSVTRLTVALLDTQLVRIDKTHAENPDASLSPVPPQCSTFVFGSWSLFLPVWSCDACTLENAGASIQCSMCGTPRPRAAAPAAAAPSPAHAPARPAG